jgi:hypothetical protein
MNKNKISKTIMYAFIAVFLSSSIMVSSPNMAFAFLGFFLGGGEEEEQQSTGSSQSSSSLQSARCYSPHGSIVDSCNSGDLSSDNYTGYNGFVQ